MKWITREHPKFDRIACPSLIQRFIDRDAEILYGHTRDDLRVAQKQSATPFDVSGVELTHDGPLCSFDEFLQKYALDDPALTSLAAMTRAADTDTRDQSREAPGLLAITLGLGANISDHHALLQQGCVIYDALYTGCRSLKAERHGWYPETILKEVKS